MVELKENTPLAGLVPVESGNARIEEVEIEQMASVMPYQGQGDACSAALQTVVKLALPAVGAKVAKSGVEICWSEAGQWFVSGIALGKLAKALKSSAAVVDQSDAWAAFEITGEDATDVMARLCPLDLSDKAFGENASARTEFSHMMSLITRTKGGFRVLVMRSFARTAWHHAVDALNSLAAQRQL